MGMESITPSLTIKETTIVSFTNPFNGLAEQTTLSQWLQTNSFKLIKIVDDVVIVQETLRYHQYCLFFMKVGCLEQQQIFEVIEYCDETLLCFIKDAKKYLLLFQSREIREIKRMYPIKKDNEYWIVMEDKAKRLNAQGIALETVREVMVLHHRLFKKSNDNRWTIYEDGQLLWTYCPSDIIDLLIDDESQIVFYCRENVAAGQWFYLLSEQVSLADSNILYEMRPPFEQVQKYQGKIYLQKDTIWYVLEKGSFKRTSYQPRG